MLLASGTEIVWRVSLKFKNCLAASRFHGHRSYTKFLLGVDPVVVQQSAGCGLCYVLPSIPGRGYTRARTMGASILNATESTKPQLVVEYRGEN